MSVTREIEHRPLENCFDDEKSSDSNDFTAERKKIEEIEHWP